MYTHNHIPIHERNPPVIDGDRILGEVFDHATFIADMAKWIKPDVYLEYGVRNGHTLIQVLPYCKQVIGVDIDCIPLYAPNLEMYEMTTDAFSEKLESMGIVIDMAFIDADHKSDSVLKDFHGIFPYLAPNGIVFLHDTYPTDVRLLASGMCNDCWKTPDVLKTMYKDTCEVFTIPVCPGLTMVRKVHNLEWKEWKEW